MTPEQERIARLESALMEAACWFDDYAAIHAAKGTQEALEKAATNRIRATHLRRVLDGRL